MYLGIQTHIYTHVITINEKRGHEFEKGAIGGSEERKGRVK